MPKDNTPDEAEREAFDSLVAEICTMIRFRTASPAEGFMVLETALFALWQRYNSNDDLPGFLQEFVRNVLTLKAMNTIKGGMN